MSEEPVGPPPAHRDPEFDEPLRVSLLGPLDEPESYLRLVANPFLGFVGYVLCVAAFYWVISLKMPPELIAPLLPFVIVLLLFAAIKLPVVFQYHCLDCGRTGRLSDWRDHVCNASMARRASGRRRLLRGPSPTTQVVLWLVLLLGAGVTWLSCGGHLFP